ncbi:MAG: hypothetical protein AB1644_06960 [Candidatus Zixiibacteriota bacterium]
MRKFVFLGLVLLGVGIMIACRDDIVVKSEESVEGTYDGWLIFDSAGATGKYVDSQPCVWIFKADTFTFRRPDSIPESVARVYCDSYGLYLLSDGLVLEQNDNWTPGPMICDEKRNLKGRFVVILHTETDVTFSQGSSGVIKTVRLHKI